MIWEAKIHTGAQNSETFKTADLFPTNTTKIFPLPFLTRFSSRLVYTNNNYPYCGIVEF
jgi:hypothetical protein